MADIHFALLGAGGFAREVMPYVKQSVSKTLGVQECEIKTYFVETWKPALPEVNGYPLISLDDFIRIKGSKYYNVAVADGHIREEMSIRINEFAEILSIAAPQSIILERNIIGPGAVHCPNSMITSNAIIGDFFQANIYSYVAHDCVIGDFVTFAPGVRCNGRVHIGDYAYIGTNAIIKEGTSTQPLRIGAGAIVGMGAVVTKDVPDGVTVVGNPARILSK